MVRKMGGMEPEAEAEAEAGTAAEAETVAVGGEKGPSTCEEAEGESVEPFSRAVKFAFHLDNKE